MDGGSNDPDSLKLQPVFLNDSTSNSKESDSNKPLSPMTLQPHLTDSQQLTTEDLWNMWNVATKAKSSINQGRRLENLSWRLWYSTAMKPRKDDQKSSPSDCTLEPALAKTCSFILQEIQSATTSAPFPHSSRSNEGANEELLASSPASPSIAILPLRTSTNEYLVRKKKKNIERYMRKYKRRLDGISEEIERTSDGEGHPDHQNGESTTPSTEAVFGAANRSIDHDTDSLFIRRPSEDSGSPKSADSGNPSLLSMLLNRARSGSCPEIISPCCHPDIPFRPNAPIPTACPTTCFCYPSTSTEEDFLDCCESINEHN